MPPQVPECGMYMPPAVWTALVGALVVMIGWFVTHWLTVRREEARRRIEAQMKFVERQIEELYGPLAAVLYEGRRTFIDLLDSLGRKPGESVFLKNRPLPPEELKTWLFWAETEFLPRNEQIKYLLKTKAHLIDNGEFPDTYVMFLDHSSSWAIHHRRWKEQQVEYSWHSKINWPLDFQRDVLATFQHLKQRHTELIGALLH